MQRRRGRRHEVSRVAGPIYDVVIMCNHHLIRLNTLGYITIRLTWGGRVSLGAAGEREGGGDSLGAAGEREGEGADGGITGEVPPARGATRHRWVEACFTR